MKTHNSYNLSVDYVKLISIALNVVLLAFLLRCCSLQPPCAEQSPDIKVKVDTIRPNLKDVKPIVISTRPEPVKVLPVRGFFGVTDSSGAQCPAACLPQHLDTAIYYDSLHVPDSYAASFTDTITGNRLTGRTVRFYNLTPVIKETITVTNRHTEKIGVYAGGFAGARFAYGQPAINKITGWSAGPAVLVTFPKGVAVQYGFDALNNGHSAAALFKIRLKNDNR